VYIPEQRTFQLTGSVQEQPSCLALTAEKAALCVSTSLEAKTERNNKDKDNRNVKTNKTKETGECFSSTFKISY
jgi:hypothetical protein